MEVLLLPTASLSLQYRKFAEWCKMELAMCPFTDSFAMKPFWILILSGRARHSSWSEQMG